MSYVREFGRKVGLFWRFGCATMVARNTLLLGKGSNMSRRSNGEGCNPSYFRDKFKVTLTAIEGVRVLTLHSCRHTYVSQLQALGVDYSTIQSLVGHVDTDMTQHYLHVQSPVRLDAAERFSEAFCRPK